MAITTIGSYTLNSYYTGYTGGIRCAVPMTGGAGKQIRCTIFVPSLYSLGISHWSIGVWAGTLADTQAVPVELLVGGNQGFSVPGGTDTTIVSDWVNFTGFSASDMLVCLCDVTGGTV
jgi:hypothetical protein